MLEEWLEFSLHCSMKKASFYSGARKIIRNMSYTFYSLDNSLQLSHAGYTKSKLTLLKKLYLHEESHETAKTLWLRRREQGKYGSVGFTTYNHFIKNDPDNKGKRASVMGPCIQSVVLTLLPNGKTAINVYYRTTEAFKKFPADLVFLRDVLLPDFELGELDSIHMDFANVTAHPMYFVTVLPELEMPLNDLARLKRIDEYFHNWVVKWTARYLCPEHHRGIAKFAQAMRVHADANSRIKPALIKDLRKYLNDNHPGYKNAYEDPDELD